MTASEPALPTSRHFTLTRVGEGVWAAIATPGAGAESNAGIVDLGDETLVFDAMYTAPAARDLRAAAEALTGRAARYVVNSCAREEYIFGSGTFAGASIIASDATYIGIINHADLVLGVLVKTHGERIVRERTAEAKREPDPLMRASLLEEIATMRELVASANEIHGGLPDVIIEQTMEISGRDRRAVLTVLHGGYTVLQLPEQGILLAGDLVNYRYHPTLETRGLDLLPKALDEIGDLSAGVIVPGHGDITTHDAIAAQRAYFATLLGLAREVIEAGGGYAEIDATTMPEAWRSYGALCNFPRNMRRAYQHLTVHHICDDE